MRLLVPSTLAFSVVLALACAGGGSSSTTAPSSGGATTTEAAPPAPPAPPTTPATSTGSTATAPTAPAAPAAPAPVGPFPCCDNERAGKVLEEYLDLQAALAKDDARQAGGEFSSLQSKADTAKDKGGMDEESKKLLETIRAEAYAGAKTADMKQRREHFKKISAAMIPFVKLRKGGSRQVAEAWCPMVEAGWVQEGTVISNPYDPSMARCGVFK